MGGGGSSSKKLEGDSSFLKGQGIREMWKGANEPFCFYYYSCRLLFQPVPLLDSQPQSFSNIVSNEANITQYHINVR